MNKTCTDLTFAMPCVDFKATVYARGDVLWFSEIQAAEGRTAPRLVASPKPIEREFAAAAETRKRNAQ